MNNVCVNIVRIELSVHFTVPFEMLVCGVENLLSPTVENTDFKIVDVVQVIFWNTEIIVYHILVGRRDGVGQVDLEKTVFDDKGGGRTAFAIESGDAIYSGLIYSDLHSVFARTP